MSNDPYQLLDKFNRHQGVSVDIAGQGKVLEAKRDSVTIRVTVPKDVLEWFVDAAEDGIVAMQDWFDYEGYDDTPRQQLARQMASDVDQFVTNLLNRNVRLVPRAQTSAEKFLSRWTKSNVNRIGGKHDLEWKVDGSWEQATVLRTAN